jgi:hypothetical protein
MRPKVKKSDLQYTLQQNQEKRASQYAEDILKALGLLALPVDPLAVAATEGKRLKVAGGDFKDNFDGLLEYHAEKETFLLLYNTKYDTGRIGHHPRTRFSIAHELGHVYLEHHRAFLLLEGKSHLSSGEFAVDQKIEREADAFAAGLLMPETLIRPLVNAGELTSERIRDLGEQCQTSFTTTARRCVACSDFPCDIVAIQNGRIAWRFPSKALIEGQCYPLGKREALRSTNAYRAWQAFSRKEAVEEYGEGPLEDWFTYYGAQGRGILVSEYYIPIPPMDTLLVLLTVSEEDLASH